jgi:protein-S-isoprenylcysteine O-methyltransferase Ste14
MVSLPALHHQQHPIMFGVWVATCALWILPETAAARRLRSAKDAQKADRGSMAAVFVGVYLGVFLGFRIAVKVPSLAVPHWKTWFVLGIVIWLGGIVLRWYSIYILGRFFTFDVAISTGQHVVERGPYRWVRHPSYLGGLLAMAGLGMTLSNWLAMLLPPCCLAVAYMYRIPIEERALVRGLGSEYSDYMRRTRRLIPYIF